MAEVVVVALAQLVGAVLAWLAMVLACEFALRRWWDKS